MDPVMKTPRLFPICFSLAVWIGILALANPASAASIADLVESVVSPPGTGLDVQASQSQSFTVSGVVENDEGIPLPAHRVAIQSEYGIDVSSFLVTTTNHVGEFEITGVESGEWRIRVTELGRGITGSALTEPISFTADREGLRFVMPRPKPTPIQPGTGLRPRMESDQGKPTGVVLDVTTLSPIPGAVIKIEIETDDKRDLLGRYQADERGRFLIPDLPAKPATHWITVTKSDYHNVAGQLNPGSNEWFFTVRMLPEDISWGEWMGNLRLRPSAFDENGNEIPIRLGHSARIPWANLEGFLHRNGEPVTNASVEIRSEQGEELMRFPIASTETDGAYIINSRIEPGTYTLRIEADGQSIDIPGITLTAGPNQLNLEI